LKHCVRPGKSDDDESFLDNEKQAYDHLEIICYGSDAFDTHTTYEVDLENNIVDSTKSKFVSKGDGTLYNKTWKHTFGGLEKKIVHAEEGSNHMAMCNDLKLKEIMMELFFPNSEKREQVVDIFAAKSDRECM